ncbi:hypothetical protein CKO15_13550 [Halorhodospira abdelmalekii]|uniref:CRISPR-associated endonuclease Cas1 n=1 Tax=Halorhodospira abdelmalekii TaxID=421629 RepID=UPI001907BFCC|nr:CRISPR-associated endonuclease Cas1 [Halorhodospira abdelmalekii]MBK1736265.1 hypothetical protein [Halorhodospira abdelmalekii]
MSRLEPRTLYVDTEKVDVRCEGAALRIQRSGRAATYVPIVRISRVVIRGHSGEGLLGACLALAQAGAVIHFQTGHGQTRAWLQPAAEPQSHSVQELSDLIDHTGLGPYHWWRDAQRRHAWSVVFRQTPRGDFQSACKRMEKYLKKLSPMHWMPHEIEALGEDLRCWLQAELHRCGWHPVCRTLAGQGQRLEHELHRCLYIPLLWRFVRWRRQQPLALEERRRLEFQELQLASPMPRQLHLHLRALSNEYHVSWKLMQVTEDSEDADE